MNLLECVPNFSEGRDQAKIRAIVAAMEAVIGVQVLHVDIGEDANRTVVTLAGPPKVVVEAAYRGIQKASEVIDMRKHTGAHPRMGATDVCPLIPLAGISMEETVALATKLGERVGRELGIPVYLYERSALRPERANLATIRAGEFEGLKEKFLQPDWVPDFGPRQPHPSAGGIALGARPFLLAFNVNLNTTSVKQAKTIAGLVRESGNLHRKPGDCTFVKAIGWFQESFGIAQVSMNLTNPEVTPLHEAFEACSRRATELGIRVTGSELVGMTPLKFLLESGKFYHQQSHHSPNPDEKTLVNIAIRSLGLNDIRPFIPDEKIIEYKMT